MRILCLLLISLVIQSHNETRCLTGNTAKTNYVLDTSWVQTANKYIVSQPTGIGIDKSNHIFVFQRTGRHWTEPFPDSLISQNTVFEFDSQTGKVINAWGANLFLMPHGLTVDKDNNVWVTDVALQQIFKFSHEGKLLMKLGTAKVAGDDASHFNLPTDVAVADDGTFYVSDGYGNSRVAKFSPSGRFIKSWGKYGSKPGEFIIPHGIAIDNKNIIYVADRQNNRIQLFDTSGRFLKELKNNEEVEQVPSIAIGLNNSLFAIDYDPRKKPDSTVNGSTFFEFDKSQHIINHIGADGSPNRISCWFHDIAVDKNGNIYVGDIIGSRVLKFEPVKGS